MRQIMVCLKEDQPKGRERKHANLNEERKNDDKRMREDDDDPEAQLREGRKKINK